MTRQAILDPQDALIATMVLTSCANRDMSEAELREIAAIVDVLPALRGYDKSRMRQVSDVVVDLLEADDGLDALIGMIRDSLPRALHETAYALACDVAAADGDVVLEELRLLEMMRHMLKIDRLNAAAIERGSRARHMRMP